GHALKRAGARLPVAILRGPGRGGNASAQQDLAMSFRTSRFASCAAFTLLVLFASTHATDARADAYVPPRTAWEHPEIQGLFTSNTDVPFERPRELGEKEFFTEAEYQARRRAAPAQATTVRNLRTSLITFPANGR